MNRTLKIFLIVGLTGLLLLALAALALFKYVSEHKDDWLAKGRDALQEGIAAGKTLRDDGCLDEALAQHREGRAGVAGIGARLWLKGCLQNAAPTPEFCRDVPLRDDITGSVRWRLETCAKHGLTGQSTCGGTLEEVQGYCQTRAEP